MIFSMNRDLARLNNISADYLHKNLILFIFGFCFLIYINIGAG
jgi:hypothetical protein